MSKGKEALASRNAQIQHLKQQIANQHKEIQRLVLVEKTLNKEVLQLKTYKDRVNESNQSLTTIKDLESELQEAYKAIDMWAWRAIILAKADQELEESMFSAESLAVLTEMKMLPKSITHNRTAKRNAKTGGKIKKHIKSIDSTIKELQGQGIEGLHNV